MSLQRKRVASLDDSVCFPDDGPVWPKRTGGKRQCAPPADRGDGLRARPPAVLANLSLSASARDERWSRNRDGYDAIDGGAGCEQGANR